MKELKVVIAGSRNFNEKIYHSLMIPKLEEFFGKLKEEYSPIIISGCAAGADKYGERYGLEHNIPIEKYPAEGFVVQQTSRHRPRGIGQCHTRRLDQDTFLYYRQRSQSRNSSGKTRKR